mmetsp:Transcript_9321/g.7093  ORF Transcript_9321/g.7093 Transcript_9321/m.7093 type:complete len:120 (-) Transcript_9321:104-463(-)
MVISKDGVFSCKLENSLGLLSINGKTYRFIDGQTIVNKHNLFEKGHCYDNTTGDSCDHLKLGIPSNYSCITIDLGQENFVVDVEIDADSDEGAVIRIGENFDSLYDCDGDKCLKKGRII